MQITEKKEVDTCKESGLNSQTRIGLTFGQIITLITYTVFVVALYFDAIGRIKTLENNNIIQNKVNQRQDEINERLIQSTENIEKSLIRIDGKLDLKKDKYEKN